MMALFLGINLLKNKSYEWDFFPNEFLIKKTLRVKVKSAVVWIRE